MSCCCQKQPLDDNALQARQSLAKRSKVSKPVVQEPARKKAGLPARPPANASRHQSKPCKLASIDKQTNACLQFPAQAQKPYLRDATNQTTNWPNSVSNQGLNRLICRTPASNVGDMQCIGGGKKKKKTGTHSHEPWEVYLRGTIQTCSPIQQMPEKREEHCNFPRLQNRLQRAHMTKLSLVRR